MISRYVCESGLVFVSFIICQDYYCHVFFVCFFFFFFFVLFFCKAKCFHVLFCVMFVAATSTHLCVIIVINLFVCFLYDFPAVKFICQPRAIIRLLI